MEREPIFILFCSETERAQRVLSSGAFFVYCRSKIWTGLPREKSFRALRYNQNMARGWESKSVEAQQAEAIEQSSKSRATRLSPEEAARIRVRDNLRLARRRVLQQLESSQDERHRKVLQESLAAVDEKLRSLAE